MKAKESGTGGIGDGGRMAIVHLLAPPPPLLTPPRERVP